MTGRIIGLARRPARKAPMETLNEIAVTTERGVEGDHKGAKFKRRQITILAIEDWRAALADISVCDRAPQPSDVLALPWTVRRANILVEGLRLPRAPGAILRLGAHVEMKVFHPTVPCKRMEEAAPGLLKALSPDWRGGVSGQVLTAGHLRLGDAIEILSSPPEMVRRLPA